MPTKSPPGPFVIIVQECHHGYQNKGWIIFGDAHGRYISPGTLLTDENGEEVTILGVIRMRMTPGPSKWGWVVDREVQVGAVLTEQT